MHVSEVTAFVLPARPGGGSPGPGSQSAGAPRLPRLLLGPENARITRVLAEDSVAAWPGVLLFWGEANTGKSQLLEACCRRAEERFGARTSVLRSAPGFAREFARAIHTRTTPDFHERYANLALVALDDLDELGQAPAAQQALIGLIDALEERGGVMAFTAHQPPERIANIDARLRSRLSAGLVLPLAAQGPAVRRRMLGDWNEKLGWPHSADELDAMASRVTDAAELFDELAKRRQTTPDTEKLAAKPRISEIAQRTAQAFQLSLAELKGPGRERTRCDARGIAMALARELTGQSYANIGRYFGGRDHTTVRHQCQRIEFESRDRADLRNTVRRLRRLLTSSKPVGENLSTR